MQTSFALIVATSAAMGLLGGAVEGVDSDRVLSGQYVSAFQSGWQPLEVVFSPTGIDTWDVVFHFKFHGKAHEFTGCAEGNLDEGPLSGSVENESKQRTFRFEGTFRDGEFRGTHAEIKRTGERRTGSLTLVEKR